MPEVYPGSERHFQFNGSNMKLEEITFVRILTDKKSITAVLDRTGDEATGDDIVKALRGLADEIESNVARLEFATQ